MGRVPERWAPAREGKPTQCLPSLSGRPRTANFLGTARSGHHPPRARFCPAPRAAAWGCCSEHPRVPAGSQRSRQDALGKQAAAWTGRGSGPTRLPSGAPTPAGALHTSLVSNRLRSPPTSRSGPSCPGAQPLLARRPAGLAVACDLGPQPDSAHPGTLLGPLSAPVQGPWRPRGPGVWEAEGLHPGGGRPARTSAPQHR